MNLSKNELEQLLPRVELYPIEKIRLNDNNPRRMTEKKFNALVKSVEQFWKMLFLRPIVLDDEDIALGGNYRTLAAKKLGFKLVPIMRAAHLTVRERAEFVIKDNVNAGDWDFDSLANNWNDSDLTTWGLPIPKMPDLSAPDLTGARYDGTEDVTATKRQTKTEREESRSFNILLKAETELARQELITFLTEAGYLEDEHFICL